MNSVCGDNRFEIIAKVKEHLIKATNIEMHPEELAQVDNVLFRLWQLGYFYQSELEKELKAEKEYSATLRKEIDEYTNSHTLCAKYKELEKAYNEAEELLDKQTEATYKLFEENKELKELVEKYRQAVDKCLHITFMGGGCEVNTIGQYATLVDGYLTDVEGLAKWKN